MALKMHAVSRELAGKWTTNDGYKVKRCCYSLSFSLEFHLPCHSQDIRYYTHTASLCVFLSAGAGSVATTLAYDSLP